MAGKARHRGPDSRPHTLQKLDQRTREAALLRRVRAELTAHVGGNPSATQRMLIDRLAKVSLRLELYDRKFALGEPITDHDSRTFAALHSACRLMLKQLGMKAAPPKLPTLAEYSAAAEARRRAGGGEAAD